MDLTKFKFVPASKDEIKKYSLVKGDILFNNTNSDIWVGKTAFVDRDLEALFSNHLTRLRVDTSKVNPHFLAMHLQKLQKDGFFRSISTRWVNQTAVNTNALLELTVKIPSLDHQRRIVAILDRADTLKRKREQANHMTDEFLKAVFLKMFGRGSPENRIADVAEFVSSGATPLGGEKTYLPEGITFIRSQNVLMNKLQLKDAAHISEDVHKEMRRTWVKNGDVLLNITGASLGRVAVYAGEDDKANVNQHVCVIRLNRSKAVPEYVSHYLSMHDAQNEIWTIQAGASRQALNFEQVKSLKIYLAPIHEQRTFASIVDKINSLKERQHQSTQEIDELFSSLMHKAFRGELNA